MYVMAKNGVRIATDPNSSNPFGASNGNLTVDGTMSAGGTITSGGDINTGRNINMPAGHTITSPGRIHISTNSDRLYLLPKDGVHITNDWGGTGNLRVTGTTSVDGALSAGSVNTGGALSAGSLITGGALSAGSVSTGSVNIYNYGDVKTKLDELFRLMPVTINFVGQDTDHSYENRTLSFIQESVALMGWAHGGDSNYNHRIGILNQRGRDLGFGSSWARHMNNLRDCRTVTMNIPPGKMVKIWTWDDDAPRVFRAGIHSSQPVGGSAGAGVHMIWVGNESRANDIPDSLRMASGFRI